MKIEQTEANVDLIALAFINVDRRFRCLDRASELSEETRLRVEHAREVAREIIDEMARDTTSKAQKEIWDAENGRGVNIS